MDLFDSRLAICKKCPLFKIDPIYGPVCNKALYISTEDKETTSYFPKPGFVKGCGCKLNWKAKREDAHCIVLKW